MPLPHGHHRFNHRLPRPPTLTRMDSAAAVSATSTVTKSAATASSDRLLSSSLLPPRPLPVGREGPSPRVLSMVPPSDGEKDSSPSTTDKRGVPTDPLLMVQMGLQLDASPRESPTPEGGLPGRVATNAAAASGAIIMRDPAKASSGLTTRGTTIWVTERGSEVAVYGPSDVATKRTDAHAGETNRKPVACGSIAKREDRRCECRRDRMICRQGTERLVSLLPGALPGGQPRGDRVHHHYREGSITRMLNKATAR